MARKNRPPAVLGSRYPFTCPVCGDGNADASLRLNRDGAPEWFVGCFSTKCATNSRYLGDLGEALGIGRGAAKPQLAAAVYRLGGRASVALRRQEALPSNAQLEGWRTALLASGAPLEYLITKRRLSLATVRENRIGWDHRDLIFPMFHRGRLVAAKRRAPSDGAQMKAWAGQGRAWPLYPEPDRRRGWTLLVAGEFDALAARSVGVPASSVTLGAGHWREQWADDLRGLVVVVCFDTNEAVAARRRVKDLSAAGLHALRLDLSELGVTNPKGDLNDYLARGASPTALRKLVRARAGDAVQ